HAAARVPGTVNIPLDRSFNTWAGWLIPYDRDFYLIVNDAGCPACIDEAVRDLAMIGLERIAGWFGVDAIDAWRASGQPLESIAEITPRRLYERLQAGDVTVVDVRSPSEWESGHLPGVPNVPLSELIDRLDRLPRDRPVIVHCQSGSRSAIAASILRSNRFDDVTDMRGGFGAWRHQKLPIETRGRPPHEHSAPPTG
ncbi:MAG: rhodanese-like domain-containing protein, partial [Longimicrobiales bacterium]